MRHSSIDLTMNVYTDPRLLDVHEALDSLPTFSLDGAPVNSHCSSCNRYEGWTDEDRLPVDDSEPGSRLALLDDARGTRVGPREGRPGQSERRAEAGRLSPAPHYLLRRRGAGLAGGPLILLGPVTGRDQDDELAEPR